MTERRRRNRGEGTLRYDKKARRWRASVKLPDGSRRWLSAESQDEILDKRDRLRAAVLSGAAIPAPTDTVAAEIREWRSSVLPALKRNGRQRAGSTRSIYWTATNHLIDGLGKVALGDLSVAQVNRYFIERSQAPYGRHRTGLALNTLATHLNVLCQVLDGALRERKVVVNVARLAVLPAARPGDERRSLTPDECQKLLAAASSSPIGHLVTLALLTGARRGELLGLSWSAIDWEAATLTIRQGLRHSAGSGWEIGPTKTGKVRTVPLGARAIEALQAQQVEQEAQRAIASTWSNPDDLVFTRADGRYLEPETVRVQFNEVVRQAKLAGVVFHMLRHTFGSIALAAGDQEPIEIADQLGQTLQTFLSTYRHHLRPPKLGVALAVEAAIFETGGS